MQTFTSRAAEMRGHQLRAVVFAVGSPTGSLMPLRSSPVSPASPARSTSGRRATPRAALLATVPDAGRTPVDGAWCDAEAVWLLDPSQVATVHQGRFRIERSSTLSSPFGRRTTPSSSKSKAQATASGPTPT